MALDDRRGPTLAHERVASLLLGSILVAFSVALPLFMLHREIALQRMGVAEGSAMPRPGASALTSWTGWSVIAVALVTVLYTSRAAGWI